MRSAIALTALIGLGLVGCGTSTVSLPADSVSSAPATLGSEQPGPTSAPPEPAPVTHELTPVVRDATLDSLLGAHIPSLCELPAQQLVGGEATLTSRPDGGRGAGYLDKIQGASSPTYVTVDLAGLGHKQVLGVYLCGLAQTDALSRHLLLVDVDGTTLAQLNLSELAGSGYTWIREIQASGNEVLISWGNVAYLGEPEVRGSSLIGWTGSTLSARPA